MHNWSLITYFLKYNRRRLENIFSSKELLEMTDHWTWICIYYLLFKIHFSSKNSVFKNFCKQSWLIVFQTFLKRVLKLFTANSHVPGFCYSVWELIVDRKIKGGVNVCHKTQKLSRKKHGNFWAPIVERLLEKNLHF